MNDFSFKYEVEEASGSQIDLKLDFDNPMELSRFPTAPEMVNVTINMMSFEDPDGLVMEGYAVLEAFVPRLAPDSDEAESVRVLGLFWGILAAILVISAAVFFLYFKTSLIHIWIIVNGLQLITHLALLNSSFPANAQFFNT